MAFIEVNYGGGYWERGARVFLERDYLMFAYMLGVKDENDEDDCPKPRGFPEDKAKSFWGWTRAESLLECYGESWLTPDEFANAICRRKADLEEVSLSEGYDAALAYMRAWPEARLVFGFY